MTETQVQDLITAMATDLGTIGAGVVFLSVVVMGGLWVRKVMGYG